MTLKPEVCWQLPLRREDAGRRRRGPRDLGRPPVGPPALGQGRARVPLVVHRGARRVRRDQARLPRRCRPSSPRWSGRRSTSDFVALARGARPAAHEGCRSPTRRAPGAIGATALRRPDGRWRGGLAGETAQSSRGVSRSAGRRRRAALVGMEPRMRSYLSSSAMHHDAWTSSGSAPHSAHRPVDSVEDRFRLRASSKRRWRPFFTRTPCHTRSACSASRPLRPDRYGPSTAVPL